MTVHFFIILTKISTRINETFQISKDPYFENVITKIKILFKAFKIFKFR